jgi:UPF0755 protein
VEKKHFLIFLTILIVLGAYVFIDSRLHGRANNSTVSQNLTINEGEGVNYIAQKLENSGLVSNKIWLEIYLWLKNRESSIVAGTYELRPSMSIPEIVDLLTTGQGKKEDQSVTIIEGWDNKQIGEYLAEKGIFSKEDFLNETVLVEKYQPYFSFLEGLSRKDTLEGYLFPDTYNVIKGKTTAEQLIYRMLLNFDKKMTDTLRDDIKRSKHSLGETIIMASIIEKEVSQEEDRKIIAGIFWDRIKIKQPLQSCATIGYILGVNKKQYSFEDTRVDSPYNTYINRGLPPAPIGNPGLSAIKAALYPQRSDFSYFLSDPNTGETIFSRTLDEHNQAKVEHGL